MDAPQVFGILIREHERMLLAFLRGVLPEADALDVYQQSCLAAWQSLDAYDRARPFGPWLRGIATRLVLRHHRGKRPTVPLDEAMIERVGAKVDALARLPGDTWDERMDSLRRCLADIREEDRRLVDLYYRDGLTCAQIALRAGDGVEAVKKRLQRVRADLGRCLEGKLAGGRS